MSVFAWKDDYSVRVASIDSEHKVLLDLAARMHEAMTVGKGKAAMGSILQELSAYVTHHFQHEEDLMARAMFPELPAHRHAHAELVRSVQELETKLEAGAANAIETMDLLRTWLVDHIQHTDGKYSQSMTDKGIV
jgi:hemerythrin